MNEIKVETGDYLVFTHTHRHYIKADKSYRIFKVSPSEHRYYIIDSNGVTVSIHWQDPDIKYIHKATKLFKILYD